MKISVISFDYWNYDSHIVNALRKKGVDATHIDISKFKYHYRNGFEKITNFLSKTFLKKNIKKIKRQQFVLEELERLGKQDAILVVRPDLINKETHESIKGFTDQYIAYIYDSCKRFPVDHLLNGIFDRIFSFDLEDVETFGFEHITNYIYLDKMKPQTSFKYDIFIVMSPDERVKELNAIAEQLTAVNVSFKFIVVGSKKPYGLHPSIEFTSEEIHTKALQAYLKDSGAFLDLVRKGHNGLSFRVFEALAYQKKLVTTNATVNAYEFYNSNNILMLEHGNSTIDPAFFYTPYQPLDEEVYHKFTVDHFVEEIFNL